jgi:prepilin-type N-terminal cleavage/methylation domain-containing protein
MLMYAILEAMKPGGLNKPHDSRGFTIVETLIVLAVTGALLSMALFTFSGQQNKVEFSQAVRDIQSVIQTTANEVSAGYYPSSNQVTCSVGASGPILGVGASEQGSNTGCIFLGKVMQFDIHGSNGVGFTVYPIAGLFNNQGDLSKAKPTVVTDPASSVINSQLRNGLHIVSMTYTNGGTPQSVGAVSFINGLGSLSDTSSYESGSQQVSVIPIGGSAFNDTAAQLAGDVKSRLGDPAQSPPNPGGGVQICFASGGTKQSGLVTVGGNGRSISVDLAIKSTVNCT